MTMIKKSALLKTIYVIKPNPKQSLSDSQKHSTHVAIPAGNGIADGEGIPLPRPETRPVFCRANCR